MRCVLLAAVVAAAGCGGKKPAADDDMAEPPTSPPTKRIDPAPVPVSLPTTKKTVAPAPKPESETPPPIGPVLWTTVQTAYYRNEIEADHDYKGKRVIVQFHNVAHIGRDDKGRPLVGTHAFDGKVVPNCLFLFSTAHEKEVATLSVGTHRVPVRIEGTCVGKKHDGVSRPVRGYEWSVGFKDCRVVP